MVLVESKSLIAESIRNDGSQEVVRILSSLFGHTYKKIIVNDGDIILIKSSGAIRIPFNDWIIFLDNDFITLPDEDFNRLFTIIKEEV